MSDPDAFDVTATLSADPGQEEQTIEAELGDRVEIVVDGREPDSVALGDLRIEQLDDAACRRASSCWRSSQAAIRWSS